MKKFFSTVAVVLSLAVLTSCGGNAEADLVGEWKLDAGSVELELGEGIPDEMKKMVEGGQKEMAEDDDVKGASLEFKEDGTFVVSGDGEDLEGKWTVEGDKLSLEAEVEGMKGKFSFDLVETSADKVTLSLTAEDLLAQVKEQFGDMYDEASKEMPGDVDEMAKGTKVTFSLKK